MKPRRNLFLGSLLVIATLGLNTAAHAVQYTWTSDATGTLTWDTSGNWLAPNGIFQTGTSNELIFFANTTAALANGTKTITTNVPTTLSMNILTLNGFATSTSNGSTTINIASSTSAWTLGGTNPTVNLNGLNNSTRALNYDVRANLTLGANTLFTGNGTASFKFSGAIGDGGSGYGITKTGTSNLTLAGTNNYTGNLNINAGTLTLATGFSIGSTPDINLGDTTGSSTATLVWANSSLGTTNSDLVVRSGSGGVKSVQVNSGVTGTVNTLTLNDHLSKTINTGSLAVSGATTLTGGTRTLTINGGTLSLNGAVGDGGSTLGLTKAGAGTLVLGGTNTYTGVTTVTGGVLQLNSAASILNYAILNNVEINGGTLGVRVGGSGWATADVDTLLTKLKKTSGNFGIDTSNGSLTQWTAFTDTNLSSTIGLAKEGTETLILDNAGNNYTGTTAVNRGTLQVNLGANMGANTGALRMGTGISGLVGTVGNLTLNADITKGAFSIVSNTSDTTTAANIGQLSIADGKTLTVSSLSAGLVSTASGSTNTALATGTANTGGTLTVTGNVTIGAQGEAGVTSQAINFSGLKNFNAGSGASNTFYVGYGALNASVVTLASTSNTINVGTLSVGETFNNANSSQNPELRLGTGTNALQANTIQIGTQKASGVLTFADTVNGSVTITGAGGSGVSNIFVGNQNGSGSYQSASLNNKLLLAGHTANVSAGTVTVARRTGSGGGNAVIGDLTFDKGTFTTTGNVTLAQISAVAAQNGVTGVFTLGTTSASTGALTVGTSGTPRDFVLADNRMITNNFAASGSFIINGGTATIHGNILDTSTSTTGTISIPASTTTLTLDGGTLDMTSGTIGGDGSSGNRAITNLNFRSGTLKNVAQINNGAGLTKTTSGTLILEGTNSYTGDTTVSAGKLVINGSTAAGSAVSVNNLNSRLAGDGTIGGNTIINDTAIHSPGNSPGVQKFTGDLTYADGSIFEWDIDRTQTQTRGIGYDGVNVTNTLTGLDGADAETTFDAKFRIVIGDADFSNTFWSSNKSWTDIFTAADGTTAKSNWSSIFGGGFQYFYNNGTTLTSIDAPDAGTIGSFAISGSTLTWSAVPEPTSALVGLLIGAGLLRRRRKF